MKSVSLKAFPRQLARRNQVKQLRAAGRVPATIYGGRRTAQNLEVQRVELEDLIHHSVSENLLVDLTVEGDTTPQRLALVQDVQHNPLTGKVLHIDFHEVSADEKVTITVPVESTGEAVGVKSSGGVLEHVLFKLKIRALPKDIPEIIHVDVSGLEIGKSVHIGEIPAIPGVEILGSKEAPVFTVAAPVAEEPDPAAAGAAATAGDVEMIKEKKEDGTAAPGADAKKDEKAAKKDEKAPKEGEKKK